MNQPEKMMNGLAGFLAGAGLLLLPTLGVAEDAEGGAEDSDPVAQYIGVDACGKCHKRASTGDQLARWQDSRHAHAYETLATPVALELASARGIANPQESADCLRCHVTAYGQDPAVIAPTPEGKRGFSTEDGVQCETCHGAGSLYKSRKVMKSQEDAMAAGLIIPDESLCVSCHNAESPTFDAEAGFDFEERSQEIAHPNPKKAEVEAAE